MRVSSHRRGKNIWFYETGIGGNDNQRSPLNWKLKTLQTLVRELGDSNVRLCSSHLVYLIMFLCHNTAWCRIHLS